MSPKKKSSRAKSKKTASRKRSKQAAQGKTVRKRAKARSKKTALKVAVDPPLFKGIYPHTAVASLVTALLLNAPEDALEETVVFNDVGEQLNAAIKMAEDNAQLDRGGDYLKKVTVLRDFWDKDDANKALLVKAHFAIAEWLYAVIDQFGEDWVDNCYHVGHDTIKGIFSLPE